MPATAIITPGSVSVNGKGIKIPATDSPGTLLHTAIAGTTLWDEIFVDVVNTSNVGVPVTIQFGGTSSPDNDIPFTVIPQDTLKCVVNGKLLQNSLEVRAYAGTTNVLIAYVRVHTITNIVPS